MSPRIEKNAPNSSNITTINSYIQLIRISTLTKAMLATSGLVFLLLAISADARSVAENAAHDEHQSQNQLVSNQRYQNGKSTQPASAQLANGQNRCQSGWMWFNNKCWVTTRSRRDFAHAIELCKSMYNSTLPTIHSEEENEFLRQNIDLQKSPIWLYARHNHQYNKTLWLDRTVANYTRWDAGQPSDKSSLICIETEEGWYMKKAEPVGGQTECVSFWEDARWGTQVGCLVLLPVVCEKKLKPISRMTENGSTTYQYDSQQISMSSGKSMLCQSSLDVTVLATVVALCGILWNQFIVSNGGLSMSKQIKMAV